MTIYSLGVLLSQFGTNPLFHVQFYLLLLDLHTDFSEDSSGGLIFPFLEEFSTICCGPHSQFERNINNLRYTDDTTLMAESEEELKSLLMKME